MPGTPGTVDICGREMTPLNVIALTRRLFTRFGTEQTEYGLSGEPMSDEYAEAYQRLLTVITEMFARDFPPPQQNPTKEAILSAIRLDYGKAGEKKVLEAGKGDTPAEGAVTESSDSEPIVADVSMMSTELRSLTDLARAGKCSRSQFFRMSTAPARDQRQFVADCSAVPVNTFAPAADDSEAGVKRAVADQLRRTGFSRSGGGTDAETQAAVDSQLRRTGYRR